MKEKNKSIIHILFLAIGMFFSQDSLSQTNQSCETAIVLCADDEFMYDFTNDTLGCTIPLFLAFNYTGVSTGADCVTSLLPNSGTVTLYGPFDDFGLSTCNELTYPAMFVSSHYFDDNTQGCFLNGEPGWYIVKVQFDNCSVDENGVLMNGFEIEFKSQLDCSDDIIELPCQDCITSFSPNAGKYLVSAWVKEEGATMSTTTYTNSSIEISYSGDPTTTPLAPSGQIIDGWQRIEGVIEVPVAATDIHLSFETSSGTSYYDDIRFHPLDGSMMSYVYDPITLRLMAELDERNYATLYEYDEEGKLIRVKKETEKGIMTIQENRDNIKKQ